MKTQRFKPANVRQNAMKRQPKKLKDNIMSMKHVKKKYEHIVSKN